MNEIRLTAAIVGTAVCRWLGGFDGLLTALIVFMAVDYVTGVLAAAFECKLDSRVGAKGILRKVLVLVIVGMAHTLDDYVIEGDEPLLRTAVIFFYLSNEGISILENSVRIGLPVPKKLKDFLAQIKAKN